RQASAVIHGQRKGEDARSRRSSADEACGRVQRQPGSQRARTDGPVLIRGGSSACLCLRRVWHSHTADVGSHGNQKRSRNVNGEVLAGSETWFIWCGDDNRERIGAGGSRDGNR